MTEALALLTELLSGAVLGAFVVFLRVAPICALLPGFGEQTLSIRFKLTVAVCFTIILVPALEVNAAALTEHGLAMLLFRETCIGLLLGLGIRIFIMALQTAGTIAAQSTSLSQILGTAGVEPTPAMGYVLMVGAISLAMATGLHVKAAELMLISYQFFPLNAVLEGHNVADWGVAQVRRAINLAFTLAAPFVILSLLYNLALGVINKAMPQLMVAFVGAPVITMGGLVLLFVTAPLILAAWNDAFTAFLTNPLEPGR